MATSENFQLEFSYIQTKYEEKPVFHSNMRVPFYKQLSDC